MDKIEFLKLIEENQGIIHKIVRVYRDIHEDREDLFQEIVFQLWKSNGTFKNNAKVSTWVYRVALNTALVTYRKKKSNIQYYSDIPDFQEEVQDENLLSRQETLFNALNQLSDVDKAFITLYLEELSYKEIAEILGISVNYVGVKLNRIKTKIQILIKK